MVFLRKSLNHAYMQLIVLITRVDNSEDSLVTSSLTSYKHVSFNYETN